MRGRGQGLGALRVFVCPVIFLSPMFTTILLFPSPFLPHKQWWPCTPPRPHHKQQWWGGAAGIGRRPPEDMVVMKQLLVVVVGGAAVVVALVVDYMVLQPPSCPTTGAHGSGWG
jgi:hypothetical protein